MRFLVTAAAAAQREKEERDNVEEEREELKLRDGGKKSDAADARPRAGRVGGGRERRSITCANTNTTNERTTCRAVPCCAVLVGVCGVAWSGVAGLSWRGERK